MIRVSIAGATGYSGGELTALLARHPRVEIASVHSSGRSGQAAPFASLHPALAGKAGPAVTPFSLEAVLAARPEVVFLATPNELSAEVVPALLAAGAKVIDLSGAYRLRDAAAYPTWYGFTHPAPELLRDAVYGLPECTNGELTGARLVANPGCYPTSVVLALKPLVPYLDENAVVVCDSKSGVTGAGKKADLAYSFSELSGNFKAYGVGAHRHEPEMRLGLGLPDFASFVFVPHLLPIARGILSTLHVSFARPMTSGEVADLYASAYAEAPFVSVRTAGDLPDLKAVVGTPRCEIGFTLLAEGRRAVVVSVIDNLLKGAASQAVQNLNRVNGWPETEGLL